MSFLDRLKTAEDKSTSTPAQKAADFLKSSAELIVAYSGGKASEEIIEERKKICEGCDLVDSNGDLLFREFEQRNGKIKHLCGLIRHDNVLRDSKKDGCGCMLDLKWGRKKASCPNDKW